MRNVLDDGYWRCRLACMKAVSKFQKEEKGASDMVAILVLIVIIIGVASVFQNQLKSAINAAFGKLIDFIG